MKDGQREKPDGILALARETADAVGRLTMQHLRLARLEMQADLRAMGVQAALLALLVALAIVGYGLAMAGLGLVIARGLHDGLALLLIGVTHLLGAGVGIVIAVARLRRIRPMNATADEVSRSLAPLGLGSDSTAAAPSAGKGLEDAR